MYERKSFEIAMEKKCEPCAAFSRLYFFGTKSVKLTKKQTHTHNMLYGP
jgi:hypothetical protein